MAVWGGGSFQSKRLQPRKPQVNYETATRMHPRPTHLRQPPRKRDPQRDQHRLGRLPKLRHLRVRQVVDQRRRPPPAQQLLVAPLLLERGLDLLLDEQLLAARGGGGAALPPGLQAHDAALRWWFRGELVVGVGRGCLCRSVKGLPQPTRQPARPDLAHLRAQPTGQHQPRPAAPAVGPQRQRAGGRGAEALGDAGGVEH